MSLFAVILDRPSKETWGKLQSQYEKPYILSDLAALVSVEGTTTLTSEIYKSIQLGEDTDVGVFVCEVTNYNGYYYQDLWEWLRKAHG